MKESKSNNRGIKLIAPSMFMVMMTFIFAVTATFAWFSMSQLSRISGILFQVTSKEGLLIAVKQWKYKQITAERIQAEMIEAYAGDGKYTYNYSGDTVVADKQNIYNTNNKVYVYVAEIGGTGAEIHPDNIAADAGEYYVFCTDPQNASSVINANLYQTKTHLDGDVYTLSGDILCEPEDEDFNLPNNVVTEELLAKVCMNDKNATKITDVLTNATTPIDADGNATSITGLTDKEGVGFIKNAFTGGHRYTANFAGGMSATTAYKYEFDLYFKSAGNQSIVLSTTRSSVGSSAPSNIRKKTKAWADLLIDHYTDSVSQKNQYQSIGDGKYVPEGEEILAESKNAIRVGVSDSDGNPIAIWDPNADSGWTKNNPENNMALHYYNQAMGANLNRAPANATLSSETLLCNMTLAEGESYRASLKITIWLEGYDADCLDSITSQVIDIKLGFSGAGLPVRE